MWTSSPATQVEVNLAGLHKTSPVIPLNGSIDLSANTVHGTSLASISLGANVYHWYNSYYTTWAGNGYLSSFVTSGADGAFSKDFSSLADLQSGDQLMLNYYDASETGYYQSYFYTTSPTLTISSYPTTVQPNTTVEVPVTLTGAHPEELYLRWDTRSHTSDHQEYRYQSDWTRGVIGQNLLTLRAPAGGTVYFQVYASIDGQAVVDPNRA